MSGGESQGGNVVTWDPFGGDPLEDALAAADDDGLSTGLLAAIIGGALLLLLLILILILFPVLCRRKKRKGSDAAAQSVTAGIGATALSSIGTAARSFPGLGDTTAGISREPASGISREPASGVAGLLRHPGSGAVIAAITSIAEQTKLLALNAIIGAARAGDAGKGVSVPTLAGRTEVGEMANEAAH